MDKTVLEYKGKGGNSSNDNSEEWLSTVLDPLPPDHALAAATSHLDLTFLSARLAVLGRLAPMPTSRAAHITNHHAFQDALCSLGARHTSRLIVFYFGPPDELPEDLSVYSGLAGVCSFATDRHCIPPLKRLFRAAQAMSAWLALSPGNACIVQCSTGVARSGLAVAAFLRFHNLFPDVFEAMRWFLSKRCACTPQDLRAVNEQVKRYLRYFEDTCSLGGRVPSRSPIRLHQLVVHTIPNFDGSGGCSPGVAVYRNGRLLFDSEGKGRSAPGFRCYMDTSYIVFWFDRLLLYQDITIRVFHAAVRSGRRPSTSTSSTTIFTHCFNTGYVLPGIIRMDANDLFIPLKDIPPPGASRQLRFSPRFLVDMMLAEVGSVDYAQHAVHYQDAERKSLGQGLRSLAARNLNARALPGTEKDKRQPGTSLLPPPPLHRYDIDSSEDEEEEGGEWGDEREEMEEKEKEKEKEEGKERDIGVESMRDAEYRARDNRRQLASAKGEDLLRKVADQLNPRDTSASQRLYEEARRQPHLVSQLKREEKEEEGEGEGEEEQGIEARDRRTPSYMSRAAPRWEDRRQSVSPMPFFADMATSEEEEEEEEDMGVFLPVPKLPDRAPAPKPERPVQPRPKPVPQLHPERSEPKQEEPPAPPQRKHTISPFGGDKEDKRASPFAPFPKEEQEEDHPAEEPEHERRHPYGQGRGLGTEEGLGKGPGLGGDKREDRGLGPGKGPGLGEGLGAGLGPGEGKKRTKEPELEEVPPQVRAGYPWPQGTGKNQPEREEKAEPQHKPQQFGVKPRVEEGREKRKEGDEEEGEGEEEIELPVEVEEGRPRRPERLPREKQPARPRPHPSRRYEDAEPEEPEIEEPEEEPYEDQVVESFQRPEAAKRRPQVPERPAGTQPQQPRRPSIKQPELGGENIEEPFPQHPPQSFAREDYPRAQPQQGGEEEGEQLAEETTSPVPQKPARERKPAAPARPFEEEEAMEQEEAEETAPTRPPRPARQKTVSAGPSEEEGMEEYEEEQLAPSPRTRRLKKPAEPEEEEEEEELAGKAKSRPAPIPSPLQQPQPPFQAQQQQFSPSEPHPHEEEPVSEAPKKPKSPPMSEEAPSIAQQPFAAPEESMPLQQPQLEQPMSPPKPLHEPKIEAPPELPKAKSSPMPPPPPPAPPVPTPAPPPTDDPNRVKVKHGFHWSDIRDRKDLAGTLWDEMEGGPDDLDVHKFEDLFCVDPRSERRRFARMEGSPGSPAPSTTPAIIDIRRANNIGIGMSRFYKRYNTQEIKDKILQHSNAFSLDDLYALRDIMPTANEQKLFSEYGGANELLVPAEQFLLEMSKEPGIGWMTESMLLEKAFESDLKHSTEKIETSTKLLNRLTESKDLKKILKTTLDLGNLTNYDYGRAIQRSKAHGFRVDSLPNLKDVWAVDRESNLTHYLSMLLAKKTPDALSIHREFPELKKARGYELKHFLKTIDQLKGQVDAVRNAKGAPNTPRLQSFHHSMQPFLQKADRDLSSADQTVNDFHRAWTKALGYFGEKEANIKPEEMFGYFETFMSDLDMATRQIADSRVKVSKTPVGLRSSSSLSSLTD